MKLDVHQKRKIVPKEEKCRLCWRSQVSSFWLISLKPDPYAGGALIHKVCCCIRGVLEGRMPCMPAADTLRPD
jgi:hypothetical protein